jgi:C_GCAxxG_C_C family probable redox protein
MEKSAAAKKVEETGYFYFKNGYHCAEAVAASVLEAMDRNPVQAVAHATAFGGGFGRTFKETCGALSGAFIVIGHYHGRKERGGPWDDAAALGLKMRERFMDYYGHTCCCVLRDRFGEDQPEQCAHLTGRIAAGLFDLLHAFDVTRSTDR